MHTRFLTAFSLLVLTALAAPAVELNTLSPDDEKAGWRLLFDGKTTKGWVGIGKKEFPKQGWGVEDGTLKHTKGGGGGDIVTEELFDDFELSFEWRIGEAGNSGLKYNLPDPKKGVGCEYQLIDDERHPDGKRGGAKHQTAGLYDLIEPATDKRVNPVGEWNESRLIVKGNHVEHWLNGAKTVSYEFGSDALKELIAKSKYKSAPGFGVKTKSPILLQDHGDEAAFRNIKVRTL